MNRLEGFVDHSFVRFAIFRVTPMRTITSNRPSDTRHVAYAAIAARDNFDAILHLGHIAIISKILLQQW